MRILAVFLLVASALAGCSSDDGTPTDPTAVHATPTATVPVTTVTPTATPTTHVDPTPTQPTNNGFCGPPQCSPCPDTAILYGAWGQPDEDWIRIDWTKVAAAQRTDVMEQLLSDAENNGTANHDGSNAQADAQYDLLREAFKAQHPSGQLGEGRFPKLEILYHGYAIDITGSQVVC